jgi:hypothetical protein
MEAAVSSFDKLRMRPYFCLVYEKKYTLMLSLSKHEPVGAWKQPLSPPA